MTVFLLSLGGLPPTAGFVGKWYVFSAAVRAGYYDLAIIGMLTSVVSVFFYLRVVVMMYMAEPVEGVSRPVIGAARPFRARGLHDRDLLSRHPPHAPARSRCCVGRDDLLRPRG